MKTPLQQYQERFKPGMPAQICKMVCDYTAWGAANPLLLAAVRSGEPIKDWATFLHAMWDHSQTLPEDYWERAFAEDLKRLGRSV
jgi:hypothetical protein